MKTTAMWKTVGLLLAAVVVGVSVFVYRSQDVIDWPQTFSAADDVAQIAALTIGGIWALNRFAITRASRTFLEMSVGAKVVGGGSDNLLVQVVIRLKNIGASRINARKGHKGAFLYDDGWDQCQHAGTLKVRSVQARSAPALFDWYGLQAIDASLRLAAPFDAPNHIAEQTGTLEQINYLADFQDPVGGFEDADFWLEPNETYELTVPLWLSSGHYALKAFFLGEERGHGEEEYWSQTIYCRLEPPNHAMEPSAPQRL
jgi:hypothetical protein